ncbi:hypothetical protein ABCS02_17765 [Microbacterium sp. X-17]|uniref:hypothetical protein n=1 Tax=Microbacterium sp. X-17 TaxID=3144404 RepID=UPI0031F5B07D
MSETLARVQSEDAVFDRPFIDLDEQRSEPYSYRYVHGGFQGTETRFSFYFPSSNTYEGRFFQHITPVPESENLALGFNGIDDKVGFAFDSGAFFVETNGGGAIDLSKPQLDNDPSIGAFRANAAVARYAKEVARQVYGDHRTYGYAYGGSGGGFRTIACAENTRGAWDGFVPHVIGSPVAIPNVFTVRMHAMRVLRDVLDRIVDATEPGADHGLEDGLNDEQREALTEVTKMGFPPKAWYGHRTMGTQAFGVLYQSLEAIDPTYFDDFWTKPGYLGHDPASSVHRDRVILSTTVTEVYSRSEAARAGLLGETTGPAGGVDEAFKGPQIGDDVMVAFRVADAPHVDPSNSILTALDGEAEGVRANLQRIDGDLAFVDFPDLYPGLKKLRVGDKVKVDNSNFLAAQTYHRHQVPGAEFTVWDQFRDTSGAPTYPQRDLLVGPLMTRGASGALQSGDIEGKMIVVEAMHDREAYPWQAHWYAGKVREHLGTATDDHLRVWMVDRALHADVGAQEHPTHTVSYLGVLHVALRQVSRWAEEGIAPARSTNFAVTDGQVLAPRSADRRRGVQPTIDVTSNGSDRAEVAVGESVAFTAMASAPEEATRIVEIAWDLDGSGAFSDTDQVQPAAQVESQRSASFATPGVYFVTARVAAQDRGDLTSPYARIENLGRVRVVVS